MLRELTEDLILFIQGARAAQEMVSVMLAAVSWKQRNREKSKLWSLKFYFEKKIESLTIISYEYSIERDAQLLANRIALLKQEEMRTWKKIEETKKRAQEVVTLK